MRALIIKRISLGWMKSKLKPEAFVGNGVHFEFSIRASEKVSVRIKNKSSIYPKSLNKFKQSNK